MNIGSGYIQRQNEAVEICKICKYKAKANKYNSLIKEIENKIEEIKNENLNYSEDEYYLEEATKGYAIDKFKELLDEQVEKENEKLKEK